MRVLLMGLVAAASLAAGGVAWRVAGRRQKRQEDGVTEFQRHLGALSPEARRSIVQRSKRT